MLSGGLHCIRVMLVTFCLAALVPWAMATQTIEVPDNFCELDKVDECQAGQCIRYDPKKFLTSPSIVTYSAHNRFGNVIFGYLMILWAHLEHGILVLLNRRSHHMLKLFFQSLGPVGLLEDALCRVHDFRFEWYKGSVQNLGSDEFRMGRALEFALDRDPSINQVHEMVKYFKKYPKETAEALNFLPKYSRYAEVALRRLAKSMKKLPSQITFVGIHDRRTDYLDYRKNTLHLEEMDENYIVEAMSVFSDEYDNVVFAYVSDDMTWAETHLADQKGVFLVGCGKPQDPECVGRDLALLAACNHTIITQGALGLIAAFRAGGDIYTEYGPLVPESYL